MARGRRCAVRSAPRAVRINCKHRPAYAVVVAHLTHAALICRNRDPGWIISVPNRWLRCRRSRRPTRRSTLLAAQTATHRNGFLGRFVGDGQYFLDANELTRVHSLNVGLAGLLECGFQPRLGALQGRLEWRCIAVEGQRRSRLLRFGFWHRGRVSFAFVSNPHAL